MKNIFKKVLCSVAVAFSCVFAAKVADARPMYVGIQIDARWYVQGLTAGKCVGINVGEKSVRAEIIQVVGHHLLLKYDDTVLPLCGSCNYGKYYISGPYDSNAYMQNRSSVLSWVVNYACKQLFSTDNFALALHNANAWGSLYSSMALDANGVPHYYGCSAPLRLPWVSNTVVVRSLYPKIF